MEVTSADNVQEESVPTPAQIKDPWLSIIISTERVKELDESSCSNDDTIKKITDNVDSEIKGKNEGQITTETKSPEGYVEPEMIAHPTIDAEIDKKCDENSSSDIAEEINEIRGESARAIINSTDVKINSRQWWLKTNNDPFEVLDDQSQGDPLNPSLSPVAVGDENEDFVFNEELPSIFADDVPKKPAKPSRKLSSLEDFGLTPQEKEEAVAAELSRVKNEQVYHTGERPAIPEAFGVRLEDNPKARLILIYEGKRTVISWDGSEVFGKSLQEMMIFACDSMNPSGGTDLREVTDITELIHVQKRLKAEDEDRLGGRMIDMEVDGIRKVYMKEKKLGYEDFDQVKDGGTYILERTLAQRVVDDLVGNRWARLDVEVDAMKHVEVDAAIDRMREGANLLINEDGRTHLRIFQLSEDHQRINWYSGDKHRDRTYLDIENVSKIVPGCDESYRLHKRVAVFYHLTFTITYAYGHSLFGGQTIKTLTITAKDEDEYDYWILGIKALMFEKRKIKINKRVLMGHSRRFQSAIEAGNPSCRPFDMPITVIQNRALNLDSTLSINPLDEARIIAKIKELKKRLDITITDMQKHPDIFTIKPLSNNGVVQHSNIPKVSSSVSVEDVVEKDRAMEAEKLLSLLEKVNSELKNMSDCMSMQLKEARNEEVKWMAERARKANEGIMDTEEPPQPYRKLRAELSYKLWECEVDIENSGDIVRRLSRRPSKRTRLMKSFADFINSVIEPKPPIQSGIAPTTDSTNPPKPVNEASISDSNVVLPPGGQSLKQPTAHKNNTIIKSPITESWSPSSIRLSPNAAAASTLNQETASETWNNIWSSIKEKLLDGDKQKMVVPEKKVELSSDSRTNTSGVSQSYLHSPLPAYPESLYALNTDSQNKSLIEIKATPVEEIINPEKSKPRPIIDLLTGDEIPPVHKPVPKAQSSIGDLL